VDVWRAVVDHHDLHLFRTWILDQDTSQCARKVGLAVVNRHHHRPEGPTRSLLDGRYPWQVNVYRADPVISFDQGRAEPSVDPEVPHAIKRLPDQAGCPPPALISDLRDPGSATLAQVHARRLALSAGTELKGVAGVAGWLATAAEALS